MSAHWDNGTVAHDPAFWAEVLRVAKPGAFLLAFGGTRTYHRLACAIEDAGWELRDMIVHWLYGSGFPKSKSCLKPSHEPILLAKAPGPLQPLQIDACRVSSAVLESERRTSKPGGGRGGMFMPHGDMPASERHNAAGRWPGNVLLSHLGGPDGCQRAGVRRVPADKRGQGRPRGTFPHSDDAWGNGHRAYTGAETAGDGTEQQQEYLCVEGCPVAELDRQAGPRTGTHGGGINRQSRARASGFGLTAGTCVPDGGSAASRFFPTFGPDPQDAVPFRYQPKASRREREAGLDDLPQDIARRYGEKGQGPLPQQTPSLHRPAHNHHPTVKPTALMAWLCKLVTPESGVVLDPFCGSGSTGVACVREGFGFIGIEMSAEYAAIARARIAYEQEQHAGPLFAGAAQG